MNILGRYDEWRISFIIFLPSSSLKVLPAIFHFYVMYVSPRKGLEFKLVVYIPGCLCFDGKYDRYC